MNETVTEPRVIVRRKKRTPEQLKQLLEQAEPPVMKPTSGGLIGLTKAESVPTTEPLRKIPRRVMSHAPAEAARIAISARHLPELGALRSEINMTLHTRAAAQIWYGRRRDDDNDHSKAYIMGLPRFASNCSDLEQACSADDPYADWYFIQVETALSEAREQVVQLQKQLRQLVTSQLPEDIQLGDVISQQPEKIELRIKSWLGFKAVYVLTDFDKLVREILLAQHVALLSKKVARQMIEQGQKALRAAINASVPWRFTSVTRDDIAANNQVARLAIEKMGVVPADILSGQRRSDNAPDIRFGDRNEE